MYHPPNSPRSNSADDTLLRVVGTTFAVFFGVLCANLLTLLIVRQYLLDALRN